MIYWLHTVVLDSFSSPLPYWPTGIGWDPVLIERKNLIILCLANLVNEERSHLRSSIIDRIA